MNARDRCVRSLLEIDVEQLEDADLLPYIYALRKALEWNPREQKLSGAGRPVLVRDEIEQVKEAIERNGWSAPAAAKELGISVVTIRWRLRKYAEPAWRERYALEAQRAKARSPGRPRRAKVVSLVDRELEEARELMDAQA